MMGRWLILFSLVLGNVSFAANFLEEESTTKVASFQAEIHPLSDTMKQAMTGVSWQESCPVSLEDLVLIDLDFWGFDQSAHKGQLIVHKAVAQDAVEIFKALFEKKFPLQSLQPIESFKGSDITSMEANNSSAFNCRATTAGNQISMHSYGLAIDINPLMNPYVTPEKTLPEKGRLFLDRTQNTPGMITKSSPAFLVFNQHGWAWGGDFTGLKDYQHFEKSKDVLLAPAPSDEVVPIEPTETLK